MALAADTNLGSYKIELLVGRGGMPEVDLGSITNDPMNPHIRHGA